MDISDLIIGIVFIVTIAASIFALIAIFQLPFWIAAILGTILGWAIVMGAVWLIAKIFSR